MDLVYAVFTRRFGDDMPPESGISGNTQLLTLLATSVAMLVGCVLMLAWRLSSGCSKSIPPKEPPKPLVVQKKLEVEVDDGQKRIIVLFGTQTGTAEGFAKSFTEEAKARYEKASFRVVDLEECS